VFLDNNIKKQGVIFEGAPIFKPEVLRDSFINNDVMVLVDTTTSSKTLKIIEKQLCNLKLQKRNNFLPLAETEKIQVKNEKTI